MSIKPSAAAEIRTLIESLGATDEVKREAAVARLSVIGARAIDRLAAVFVETETSRATKAGILRVLEAVGDARAIPLARRALQDGGDVAVAATGALRSLLGSSSANVAAESLDILMTSVLDDTVDRRVRAAAVDALQDVPEVRDRIGGILGNPPDGRTVEALWQDATEGRLPDAVGPLREAVQLRAASAPLGILQKLVDAVRARETSPGEAAAVDWRAARGALHQALALRGSRIAVYDLRETVESATDALPSTFLTALHLVGDESCLSAIAAAHKRSTQDPRWRQQLEAAFHAIVKREKLSRKPSAKLLAKRP
jgi:HEAT repeat protein